MAQTAHPLDLLPRQRFRVAEMCSVAFFFIINQVFLVSLLPAWLCWGLCQLRAEVEGCTRGDRLPGVGGHPLLLLLSFLEGCGGSWALPWGSVIPGDGEELVLSAQLHRAALVGNILGKGGD